MIYTTKGTVLSRQTNRTCQYEMHESEKKRTYNERVLQIKKGSSKSWAQHWRYGERSAETSQANCVFVSCQKQGITMLMWWTMWGLVCASAFSKVSWQRCMEYEGNRNFLRQFPQYHSILLEIGNSRSSVHGRGVEKEDHRSWFKKTKWMMFICWIHYCCCCFCCCCWLLLLILLLLLLIMWFLNDTVNLFKFRWNQISRSIIAFGWTKIKGA